MMVKLLYFELSIQFNVSNAPLHRYFTSIYNLTLFVDGKKFLLSRYLYLQQLEIVLQQKILVEGNRDSSALSRLHIPTQFTVFRPFDYSFHSFPPSEVYSLSFIPLVSINTYQ